MASGAAAVQDPPGDDNQPAPPVPPNPNPPRSGLTRLCPGCGTRRPIFHFYRRNARSRAKGNLVVNCAACRGFRPTLWVNTLAVVPRETDENRLDLQNGNQNNDGSQADEGDQDEDGDSDGSDSDDSSYDPRHSDRRYVRDLVRRTVSNMADRLGGGEVQIPGEPELRDESEWILTGMGVLLYFFGWFSIVTLFVVIVAF